MSNRCVDVSMFTAETLHSNEGACAYQSHDCWPCPRCTYNNPETRSYCDICFTKSPNDQSSSVADHTVVLLPNDANTPHQPPQLPPLYSQLYGQLQQGGGLNRSTSAIECPICMERIAIGQGIVLSECLHEFCRDCLAKTVRFSGESLVRCPAVPADAPVCDGSVADIEIREILSEAEYAEHLQLSLRQAEIRTTGSFHCKTPNCAGWCIVERDAVPDAFDCPVCRVRNCMLCEVNRCSDAGLYGQSVGLHTLCGFFYTGTPSGPVLCCLSC